MENILFAISKNRKIARTNPSSIVFVEWIKSKNLSLETKNFYQKDESIHFHTRSANNLNSSKY